MAKQRIPKDITIEDLAIFAESIGCIVDIRFTDKQRRTKHVPDICPVCSGKRNIQTKSRGLVKCASCNGTGRRL